MNKLRKNKIMEARSIQGYACNCGICQCSGCVCSGPDSVLYSKNNGIGSNSISSIHDLAHV